VKGEESMEFYDSLNGIGIVYLKDGKADQALQYFNKALNIC